MPSAKPTAILLLPEAPYPAIGGGALRSASLVEHFARHYTVDVIHFRLHGEPDPSLRYPAGLIRDAFCLDLPHHSKSFLPRLTRNLRRAALGTVPLVDRFSGQHAALTRILHGRRYHVALLEHFWTAPYAEIFSAHAERLVLDLHNLESEYFATHRPLASPAQAILLAQFEQAALRLERHWLPRFHTLLTTSAENARRCQDLAQTPAHVIPNTIPLQPQPQLERSDSLVFSGNFAYQPNQDALRWFRTHVWPALLQARPQLRLRLVGKEVEAVAPLFSTTPGIDLVGPVADALPAIAQSKVAIVPILSGSGTRLKIIEAWASGTPVVSTAFGAAGLIGDPGVHLLLADSPETFAQNVLKLFDNEEARQFLAQNARSLYEAHYTWDSASEQMKRIGL